MMKRKQLTQIPSQVLLGAILTASTACADGAPVEPESPVTLRVSLAAAPATYQTCQAQIPVSVTVTGDRGRAVKGALLNFRVLSGGGRVYAGSGLTDANGVVKDIWTLGAAANTENVIQVRAVDPATGQGQSYAELRYTTASKIVFSKSDGTDYELFTANPDGTGVAQLTDNAVHDLLPAWSPDGRRIAFVRGSDLTAGSDLEIYVVKADGTGTVQLTQNTFADVRPTWSPDNQRIAFASQRPDSNLDSRPNLDIYVVRADGTGEERLTTDSGIETHPAWSPDGRKIAFTASRDYNAMANGVWVMNTDGTGQRPVSAVGSWDQMPTWSPDGRRIAFADLQNGSSDTRIVAADADGTGRVAVTQFGTNDILPSWSPDGGKILFASGRDGGGIYTINTDGSGVALLMSTANSPVSSASWSGCTT